MKSMSKERYTCGSNEKEETLAFDGIMSNTLRKGCNNTECLELYLSTYDTHIIFDICVWAVHHAQKCNS